MDLVKFVPAVLAQPLAKAVLPIALVLVSISHMIPNIVALAIRHVLPVKSVAARFVY